MNHSIQLTEQGLVASWYLTLYNHPSILWSTSKMSESVLPKALHPVSIKIVMDLPVGVDPKTIDKIGEYMPLDLFFDGLLDYVYNDCLRNLLEAVSMASEDIENVELRHVRETALMELINDNVQTWAELFRKQLMYMTLYFGEPTGKYVIEHAVYDSSNESLAARVVLQDQDDQPDTDAVELIEQENEEEDDEGPDNGAEEGEEVGELEEEDD